MGVMILIADAQKARMVIQYVARFIIETDFTLNLFTSSSDVLLFSGPIRFLLT